MKKRTYTALAGLLLAASLAAGGCSGTRGGTESEPVGTETDKEAEKPEKITVMVNGDFRTNASEAQDKWVARWEEITGIDLEIIQPDHSSYEDVLSQTLASGPENWPDVIVTPSGSLASYAQEGILWDMTDAYAASSLADDPSVRNDLVDVERIDGRLYGLPLAGGGGCVTYIRQSWLDAAGLEAPTNYEEYLAVLEAFTNKDPDGNGVDDTYGATAAGFGIDSARYFPEFYQDAWPTFYQTEDGTWVDGFTQDSMRGALERMRDAYEKGYLDPETLTNTTTDSRTKFAEGKCGVFTYWAGDWAQQLSDMIAANGQDGDLVSLPPIAEVGTYKQRVAAPIYSITSACKNPEGVFHYFIENIFDDGDMQMLWMYGVEDVQWSTKAGTVCGKTYQDGQFHMLEYLSNPGTAWGYVNCQWDNVLRPLTDDPGADFDMPEHDESMEVFNAHNSLEALLPTNDAMAQYNGDLTTLKNSVIANVVVEGADIDEELARFESEHGTEWSDAIVDALNGK